MRPKLFLAFLTLVSTAVFWLPFLAKLPALPGWSLDFSSGLKTIIANFDGPNYLIVAKTWYNHNLIRRQFSAPLPLEYYPAHLPFYPAVVATLDLFLSGPVALILATLLGTLLAVSAFYLYLRQLRLDQALWLSILFLFLPARFLVVRSVGSPEPWFIFFLLTSLIFFNRRRYWPAAVFGALAQLTKSPGILLFVAYAVNWLIDFYRTRRADLKQLPLLLIPASVLGLFAFYRLQTGNFWAYFNSGDNFHLFWPPFSIFSPQGQFWTGDFWLEEVIFVWLIYGFTALRLIRQHRPSGLFALVFFASTLFIAHRDLSRYILPIAPLALVALQPVFIKKEFKLLFAILIVPIYLYSWNFALNNTAPIADWTPYL